MSADLEREDHSARGFVDQAPDPLRYAAASREAWETTGMFCDRVPIGARVLDIGCGTGSISSLIIAECKADLIGVEPSAARAAACRARGVRVECGYYDQAMADRLGAFDVILFADVLEHLPDPASLLELAAQHLRPAGTILISVPNVAHWTVRLSLLRGRFDYQAAGIMDATHLRWFTTRTIRRVVGSIGLHVADHDWTSGAWMDVYRPIPASMRRKLLRSMVGFMPGLFACQHIVTARRERR